MPAANSPPRFGRPSGKAAGTGALGALRLGAAGLGDALPDDVLSAFPDDFSFGMPAANRPPRLGRPCGKTGAPAEDGAAGGGGGREGALDGGGGREGALGAGGAHVGAEWEAGGESSPSPPLPPPLDFSFGMPAAKSPPRFGRPSGRLGATEEAEDGTAGGGGGRDGGAAGGRGGRDGAAGGGGGRDGALGGGEAREGADRRGGAGESSPPLPPPDFLSEGMPPANKPPRLGRGASFSSASVFLRLGTPAAKRPPRFGLPSGSVGATAAEGIAGALGGGGAGGGGGPSRDGGGGGLRERKGEARSARERSECLSCKVFADGGGLRMYNGSGRLVRDPPVRRHIGENTRGTARRRGRRSRRSDRRSRRRWRISRRRRTPA